MDLPQSSAQPAPQGAQPAQMTTQDTDVPVTAATALQTAGTLGQGAPSTSAAAGAPPAAAPEEEEDPLVVAQREQEEREKALEEAANIKPYDDPDMKASSPFQMIKKKKSRLKKFHLPSDLVFSHPCLSFTLLFAGILL